MSDPRLRVIRTELDNLVSNLRGEVGEIITSWSMLRFLMGEERRLSSNDIAKDMRNQNLAFISSLRHKMHDEIVARLSELANAKIGRLTRQLLMVLHGGILGTNRPCLDRFLDQGHLRSP